MFVAVFIVDDDFKGTMNWEWILDATQMLALTVIIYLFVVYIPLLIHGEEAVSSIEDRLLLWRNILLTGGLLTRAIFSRSSYIRRFVLARVHRGGGFRGFDLDRQSRAGSL